MLVKEKERVFNEEKFQSIIKNDGREIKGIFVETQVYAENK